MSKSLLSRSKPAPDLTGPEWDSSDDEQSSGGIVASKKKGKKGMGNGDVVALDVANSTKKSSFKKGKKNKKPQQSTTTTIYLGHLPPTFLEPALQSFLSQFGPVLQLHLSRSKKSGAPKGYAFVKFEDSQTAAIVADTMSGYFLDGRRLVCHLVEEKSGMWGGKFRDVDWVGLHREKMNGPKTDEQIKKSSSRQKSKLEKKMEMLKGMGIDVEVGDIDGSVKEVLEVKEVKKRKAAGGSAKNVKKTKAKAKK
ncbi:hypothetical protein TL16_g02924 [Triparma laevis f. inornata]|uniref:RRM domain-containing protein n=2 Tax=Triparma laevis TaxID=1534972 RepID=A0A9W7AT50_9STRA|nr:hypothetical protein TL16_g02924 [Triparma laevis f. inornata]GMH75022.1 hypothetical protein TrLO_g8793 [Triparma laevis f. longispina]